MNTSVLAAREVLLDQAVFQLDLQKYVCLFICRTLPSSADSADMLHSWKIQLGPTHETSQHMHGHLFFKRNIHII